jgi:RNA polymerase sigma-70 factor (ECF subfamily)
MSAQEPTKAWQIDKHQRILRRDVTAFAQLCEEALPHLTDFLKSQFALAEISLHQTVAVDCLLNYRSRPTQYDPNKLSLFAYLRMAAKNDMLNLLDKEGRIDRRLMDIESYVVQQQLPPEKSPSGELALEEWLEQYTDKTPSGLLQALAEELSSADQQVVLLMSEGERSTARYAELLDITHLSEPEQRREVKRAKDRLTKKIQRFGKQFDQV